MPGKVFIKTFGCQMNEYDSQKMRDVLRDSHGLEETDQAERAIERIYSQYSHGVGAV